MRRFSLRWSPKQASERWFSLASCALALGAAVFACSSELESDADDGNEPPPFSENGAPSSSVPNAAPSTTTPSSSNTAPGQVGANPDQPLPMGTVNNNANNGNGYGSGSGGSGSGGSAATGAAGGSMTPNDPAPTGAGGTGNVTPAPQPTSTQPPTPQPTPTQQPTQQPQPQPPPLGGGLFLSDDFEGGMDPAWTVSNNGGGSVVIDTSRGANGSSSSLRATGGGFHIMLQYALPAVVRTNNEFYGRVYLRVDSGINDPNTDRGHFIWLEAGSTANDQNEMRIGYNINLLQVNHFGGPPGGDQDIRDRNRQITPGSFHCLQFFMDNNPEQLQVWLDGTETALSTTNFTAQRPGSEGNGTPLNDWMPPLDAFRMGWELNGVSGNTPRVIWYDDVALGTQMVPCL